MEKKEMPAIFNLRMAKSLIDDVEKETEDVIHLLKLAVEEKGFLKGLQKTWKTLGEVKKLKDDLFRAVDLANKASGMDPNIQLDDGTTCKEIIALANFQDGLIEFKLGHWDNAQKDFEDSYNIVPAQETAFNIALCLYQNIYGKRKQARYIRGINGKKIYYSPLLKKKEAQAAVRAAFERVIDIDSESDLAIEAGKMLLKIR